MYVYVSHLWWACCNSEKCQICFAVFLAVGLWIQNNSRVYKSHGLKTRYFCFVQVDCCRIDSNNIINHECRLHIEILSSVSIHINFYPLHNVSLPHFLIAQSHMTPARLSPYKTPTHAIRESTKCHIMLGKFRKYLLFANKICALTFSIFVVIEYGPRRWFPF